MGCTNMKEKACHLRNYKTNVAKPESPCVVSPRKTSKMIELMKLERCKMCKQIPPADQQKTTLQCGHSPHTQCLIFQALTLTDGTLDPTFLATFSCPECNEIICPFYFQASISKTTLNAIIDRINAEAVLSLLETQRKQLDEALQKKLYECAVCMGQFKISDIITLDCDHRFCKECVKLDLETQIGEGKFAEDEIGCPACRKGGLSEQLLRYCIGKDMTDRLMDFRHRRLMAEGVRIFQCQGYLRQVKGKWVPLVDGAFKSKQKIADETEKLYRAIKRGEKPATITQNVQQCPGLHSFAEGDQGQYIQCMVCQLQMCVRGCPITHKGITCAQYQQAARLNQMEGGGFVELAKAGIRVVKCPNPRCGALIERINGCEWVKCKCGFEICYECGIAWEWNCPHGRPGNGHQKFDVAAFMAKYK